MQRGDQIVRLSEFLDRHRGQLMSLPGVRNVGVGPRTLVDPAADVVVQIFVESSDEVDRVRERASEILDPQEMEVFVRGNLGPLRS
jgi:hypothetical protein